MRPCLVRPPALRPGDTVGVVAPAGHRDLSGMEPGIRLLESAGFHIRLGQHIQRQHRYLAGEDWQRAEDLNRMIYDPDVRMILCVRGGSGSARLIDQIDWSRLYTDPKLLAGYSDITSLHLACAARAGLCSLYGPMLGTISDGLSEASWNWFLRCITQTHGGEMPLGAGVSAVRSGTARGMLAGGCVSLLCAACGTPDALCGTDKLIILEDVHEPPYVLDRMLLQLRRSGVLSDAAGIVAGEVTDWRARVREDVPDWAMDAAWRDSLYPIAKPALIGAAIGHVPSPYAVPLGVPAVLDAQRKTLYLECGAVA